MAWSVEPKHEKAQNVAPNDSGRLVNRQELSLKRLVQKHHFDKHFVVTSCRAVEAENRVRRDRLATDLRGDGTGNQRHIRTGVNEHRHGEHFRASLQVLQKHFGFGSLFVWNRTNGSPGYVFDASSGFRLLSGAIRAPDVAYIEKSRYDALTDTQREGLAPIAPDFVVEVMSPTDRLARTQAKMDEYMTNGVRLGWLFDRKNRTVYVYRPGTTDPETLLDPASVSADPELPGFSLDPQAVFD